MIDWLIEQDVKMQDIQFNPFTHVESGSHAYNLRVTIRPRLIS